MLHCPVDGACQAARCKNWTLNFEQKGDEGGHACDASCPFIHHTCPCVALKHADNGLHLLQTLIEGYLKPMRAHDWDKGSLYSFRAMSFPSRLPYESIAPPVLVLTGEKDEMLTRSAKQVLQLSQEAQAVWKRKPMRG